MDSTSLTTSLRRWRGYHELTKETWRSKPQNLWPNLKISDPGIILYLFCIRLNPRNQRFSFSNGSAMQVRLGLFFLARHGNIGIPGISATLPFSVGLLFPNHKVLAMFGDRLTTRVVHGRFVGSTDVGHVA
jgi:hypothetical protein